jgi:hypothetical protein
MPLIDFSGPQPSKGLATKKLKATLGVVVLLGASVLGTTLASNISLNGGGNVEFGQGVALTAACDDSIVVTPISTFVNSEYATSHTFSGVSLSTIDSTSEHCDGKDFIIKAYSNSAQQDIFSSGGESYDTLRVYDNGGVFEVVSDGSDVEEMSSGSNNSEDLSDTSFTVTFNSPIASAQDIEKITVESIDHIETGLITYGTHTYQLISMGEVSWREAYADITTPVDGHCKYQLNGQCGYFATITSDAERVAVIANVGDGPLWLGGSDSAVEGTWRWIDGPELGVNFSTSHEEPSYDPETDNYNYYLVTVRNTYDHWNVSEPNDSYSGEDALQTLSGQAGLWNDLPLDYHLYGYLIEYSPDFRSR